MNATLRTWIQRMRGLFRKEQIDRELDEELTSHLEMHIESGIVFGISAKNPLMMLAAGAGVLAIAAIAAFAPLWRATRVDPMIVLRYE